MAGEVTVRLPDGSTRSCPQGTTAVELAPVHRPAAGQGGGGRHRRRSRGGSRPPCCPTGPRWPSLTADSDAGGEVLRHSTAHVLAQAVLRLWPGAHYAIGPVIEDGFYYDFELPGGAHFSDEDLDRIEATMREIMAEDQPFVRHEHSIAEGLALFGDQPFKREIIEAVGRRRRGGRRRADRTPARPDGLDLLELATFTDLCRGPHVPSTGRLGHFKLCGWPAPTGGATRSGPSSSGSTAPPGSPRRRWPSTCTGWRRPSAATTASSAPSSTCSPSPTRSARAWPSSIPRAAPSAG